MKFLSIVILEDNFKSEFAIFASMGGQIYHSCCKILLSAYFDEAVQKQKFLFPMIISVIYIQSAPDAWVYNYKCIKIGIFWIKVMYCC